MRKKALNDFEKDFFKNHMTFDHHRQCLFGELDLETCRQQNVSIRSFRHQLVTLTTNKMTYNCFDDKRVVLEDNIHTYAHGHYKIQYVLNKYIIFFKFNFV
ncbi:unnamed protein product [Aphis gossypii]|uniref:Uncharacterized protein n=1 Tax=Aphis gossypii TaxID=80765 RepID=A0A9P0INA7_APHGO|nr:unnamed protein product [Aphis gossypii]